MASFPLPHGPVNACTPIWRKLGTRKSGLETNPENEARSALLARLWCHLILQNPANCAENLTRLCSATICKTGWRMGKSGAIRSRLETLKHTSEQRNAVQLSGINETTLYAWIARGENAKSGLFREFWESIQSARPASSLAF